MYSIYCGRRYCGSTNHLAVAAKLALAAAKDRAENPLEKGICLPAAIWNNQNGACAGIAVNDASGTKVRLWEGENPAGDIAQNIGDNAQAYRITQDASGRGSKADGSLR